MVDLTRVTESLLPAPCPAVTPGSQDDG